MLTHSGSTRLTTVNTSALPPATRTCDCGLGPLTDQGPPHAAMGLQEASQSAFERSPLRAERSHLRVSGLHS